MKTLKVKITFIEELLGSSAANPDIHADYLHRKGQEKAEANGMSRAEFIELFGKNYL